MAIVLAAEKWRHYLLGYRLVVYIDQKDLRHILEQRELILGVQKWLMKLMGFDFEIFYRAGLENKAADALSCIPMEAQLNVIAVPSILDITVIEKEVQEDTKLRAIFDRLLVDPDCIPRYTIRQGLSVITGRTTTFPPYSQPWEDISMDFVERLPRSAPRGFDTILVVVDRLRKYAHFITLGHPFSAKTVAMVFIKEKISTTFVIEIKFQRYWLLHQIDIQALSDLGPMANRRDRAPAAEEQQEAGETPVLSPRTLTRRLLSVENSLGGIRETLDAVVRRLDAMNHPQQRPEEEQPNPYQWGARRRRGAELQGGCRIQENHQERRINQFRTGNRCEEQWLENQNHNQDWSSSSEEVESDATMNNSGHRFAPYRKRRAEAYEYIMKIDLPIYDVEHKKVHLVALKLKGGASTWCGQAGHLSNSCPQRETVAFVDDEEELIQDSNEEDEQDAELIEADKGDNLSCVLQKNFDNSKRRTSTTEA
ncbi:ty3-gypsy retrotransposon protein [Cucumis melo var. makuwa]|uniref:Ty3-gypsy retrotransposon protein n=1 Tax=Cucumis melo var. makuwa TaxID=1194695 RepID=A0A5A7U9B2_CUCMM|nr:ty3-gypsy retrotransposon protein [Cucumis melo var. makuwa]TYK12228.1 ty3-gypsy retrotransposon protein [Cucumis melo var. makuwa]